MMFKGTNTIGTTDYEAEMKIMAQLDEIRAEMDVEYTALREAKRRGEVTGSIYLPENQTPRLAELREKMKELQEAQRAYIVNNEYDKIYTNQGATGLNAGTNSDATVYFIDVPSNQLELWFWMESDRLLNAVFREFYSERDVVREERRMRVESNPTAKFEEQFDFMFWGSIPYHHPVIGWPSDVESINRAQAEALLLDLLRPEQHHRGAGGRLRHRRGRGPGQEVLRPDPARRKRPAGDHHRRDRADPGAPDDRDRGHQPFGSDPLARGAVRPPRQLCPRCDDRDPQRPDRAALQSPGRGEGSRDRRALRLLLGHRSTPAASRSAPSSSRVCSHEAVEAALLAEIELLKKEPVSERELAKVKNQNLANSFRRLQSNFYLLLQLLFYDVLGDWQYLNTSPAEIQAVTAEDVMRVANTYFPGRREERPLVPPQGRGPTRIPISPRSPDRPR